jgi:hypothetical protein
MLYPSKSYIPSIYSPSVRSLGQPDHQLKVERALEALLEDINECVRYGRKHLFVCTVMYHLSFLYEPYKYPIH